MPFGVSFLPRRSVPLSVEETPIAAAHEAGDVLVVRAGSWAVHRAPFSAPPRCGDAPALRGGVIASGQVVLAGADGLWREDGATLAIEARHLAGRGERVWAASDRRVLSVRSSSAGLEVLAEASLPHPVLDLAPDDRGGVLALTSFGVVGVFGGEACPSPPIEQPARISVGGSLVLVSAPPRCAAVFDRTRPALGWRFPSGHSPVASALHAGCVWSAFSDGTVAAYDPTGALLAPGRPSVQPEPAVLLVGTSTGLAAVGRTVGLVLRKEM